MTADLVLFARLQNVIEQCICHKLLRTLPFKNNHGQLIIDLGIDYRQTQGLVPRKALENMLQILGDRLKESVLQDLQKNGLYDHDPEYFQLTKVFHLLYHLFGEDATHLIMERLLTETDRFYTDQMKKNNIPLVIEA